MRNNIHLRLVVKPRAMAQRAVLHIDNTFDRVAVDGAGGGGGCRILASFLCGFL